MPNQVSHLWNNLATCHETINHHWEADGNLSSLWSRAEETAVVWFVLVTAYLKLIAVYPKQSFLYALKIHNSWWPAWRTERKAQFSKQVSHEISWWGMTQTDLSLSSNLWQTLKQYFPWNLPETHEGFSKPMHKYKSCFVM